MQQCNKYYLTPYSSIQRLLAGFFLVILALGITPRLPLHNLVANHQDGRAKKNLPDARATGLSTASYNCPVDNLVSESAFIPVADTRMPVLDPAVDIHLVRSLSPALTGTDLGVFFRGPPAN
ncbi:MAG TPA: hypothetical protein VG842_00435 [Sediminibacterium sp.]|nr:hypothetical protein [Sediminibacterium sp.]